MSKIDQSDDATVIKSTRYLFFIEQNYSYAMLRPLQAEIVSRGNEVRWFLFGDEVNRGFLHTSEQHFPSIEEVIAYQPDVCLVPGNFIPSFIPGFKVGLFHGFNVNKRKDQHFNIRACFDLYCTQGPNTTNRFIELSKKYGYFSVAETGWPALDPLFSLDKSSRNSRPTILFCSTFSQKLSSAPHLYQEIKRLSQKPQWQWLIQFHPKMPQAIVDSYKALESENLKFIETDNVIPYLQRADVMLCDTSSVMYMFMVQNKPVLTFNGNTQGDHLINITHESELEGGLKFLLNDPSSLMTAIAKFNQQLHPNRDGQSSSRVVSAVEKALSSIGQLPRKKPVNLLRNIKARKKLNYWKI